MPKKPYHMELGQLVRTKRTLDLGAEGRVEKGSVGVLESENNSPYMPYLVRFEQGTFAFQDGEIEEADEPSPDGMKNG